MHRFLSPIFAPYGLREAIDEVHQGCTTCHRVSSQGALKIQMALHQMRGIIPRQDWQVDFTHMPKHKKLRYLLVLVDNFSGWIEAFPTNQETALVVS